MARDTRILEQAAAWAARTGDSAFDDWDAFTLWLEESPEHALAYDEIVLAAQAAADALPRLAVAANDDDGGRKVRRRWFGGTVAAGLALLLTFGFMQLGTHPHSFETAPGETRLVELDDGNRIMLAGGSRLVLDRGNSRHASLEYGQALFTLRHEDTAPFTVTVGEVTLVDIGTVFDVRRAPDGVSVAVSEGAVLFNPDAESVRIDPGQILLSDAASGRYEIRHIALEQVGEWQEGRLTFDRTTLADAAEQLSRATGLSFRAIGARDARLSGSLLIEPVRADPRTLGPLLGINVRHNGGIWEIGIR